MSDNTSVHRDAFNLLCDERIGQGMSRQVFSSLLLPDCVIKIEDSSANFQNIIEWETWKAVKGTDFEALFAPCRWISPNGIVLVMEKTIPTNDLPARMPAFLADFKRGNFGLLRGQFVCHDYGSHLMLENGMTRRMRKVDWRDA